MHPGEVKNGEKARFSESGGKLLLVVVAAACAGALCVMPRPVPPAEPPSVVLDRGEVATVESRRRAAAAGAPDGAAARGLLVLFQEQGKAEAGRRPSLERRRERFEQARAALEEEAGEEALAKLRARVIEALGEALAAPEGPDRDGWLGSFPRMLARYGATSERGPIAPPFVVETLYKARFNAIVGLELVDGMEPVELRAYWGWLALHAGRAPMTRRLEALDRYAEAGGDRIAEAAGALHYRRGAPARASIALERAYARDPSLRLRNHQMAARLEAGQAHRDGSWTGD